MFQFILYLFINFKYNIHFIFPLNYLPKYYVAQYSQFNNFNLIQFLHLFFALQFILHLIIKLN